jgi:hypothetical protein
MKLPVIRHLVEEHELYELRQAEVDLLEGLPLHISVEGDDEGEQLTHILAAIDILEQIQKTGISTQEALRNYTKRVRDSISK